MNKKRLSVVMAGAMLASSVAPVLAAEVVKSEASAAELGLLIQKVRDQYLEAKKFANETVSDRDRNGDLAGESVYFLKIGNKKYSYNEVNSQTKLQDVLGKLKVGQVVEVWSHGYTEVKDGETTKYYARDIKTESKYTSDDFIVAENENTNSTTEAIKAELEKIEDFKGKVAVKVEYETTGEAYIKIDLDGKKFQTGKDYIKIYPESTKLDFTKYIGADDKEHNVVFSGRGATTAAVIKGFAAKKAAFDDIYAEELVEKITITPGGHEIAIEDLYDGLMLTEKGHDFFTMLKEADAMGRGYTVNATGKITDTAKTPATRNTKANIDKVAGAIVKDSKGNYVFKVTLPKFYLDETNGNSANEDKKFIPAETYTIISKDEKNAERLATWMLKPLARVDILAGDNRYETATKIAREYAGLTTLGEIKGSTKTNANIVLVNGNALVDGLAAAPLAATKTNKIGSKNVSAPILLTEADHLPKATKAYLKEILAQTQIGALKKVTINIVGGNTVVSKELERELFHLGFDVERFGGDNRETTSLAVAKEVEKTNTTKERFVVGADGEADAMSIAAVAAYNKTPIIVAKRGGISEDALHTFDENANVAIIGGTTVVTAAEENGLKSVSKAVVRLAGDNRKATNAKIISTYYNGKFVGTDAVGTGAGNTDHVLVAKDGQRNKTELVDALAAANFASEIKAPIVLATDKLSTEQVEALERNAKPSIALYQIGHGVARDVVKTLAEVLNLTNSNRY